MQNMLVHHHHRPERFDGANAITIFNAGAQKIVDGDIDCAVDINFDAREMVILGTQYAGEMKKGIFSFMHYLLPPRNVLTLHSSVNVSRETNEPTIFFGLSGTGKTTLSADPARLLIGDDEHGWSVDGMFNIEGGCYAKCIGLSVVTEPLVFGAATRYGAILENVAVECGQPDFESSEITPNTRASYPVEFIENIKCPCVAGVPKHIVLLTCDSFGVIPPVSKLTPAQLGYHFRAGYSAKIAGTEDGIESPVPTFSACYGHAFLAYSPALYAGMLAGMASETSAWLVNTGWIGGGYGVGERIPLKYTRAIIDAVHSGELEKSDTTCDPVFGLAVPTRCFGVPQNILQPSDAWGADRRTAYMNAAQTLFDQFPSADI